MTLGEIRISIAYLDTDTILACCKDIYLWRKNGVLPANSTLKVLSTDYGCRDLRILENMVMENAHARFKHVVPLLLKDMPDNYIK